MAILMFRTVIIYLVLLVSMRLMGKRQLGQLEVSELVVAVIVADMAAIPLQDIGIPLLNGLLPVFMLFCFEILVTGFVNKSIRFRAFLCGKPSVLIENGTINQAEMRKNRFTLEELFEELRQQGATEISSIERAVLETGGNLNLILFPDQQPPTCKQMNIPAPPGSYPTLLINDGRVLSENLRKVGRDDAWLQKTLQAHGISHPGAVYLLTLNPAGEIFVAPKETGS